MSPLDTRLAGMTTPDLLDVIDQLENGPLTDEGERVLFALAVHRVIRRFRIDVAPVVQAGNSGRSIGRLLRTLTHTPSREGTPAA